MHFYCSLNLPRCCLSPYHQSDTYDSDLICLYHSDSADLNIHMHLVYSDSANQRRRSDSGEFAATGSSRRQRRIRRGLDPRGSARGNLGVPTSLIGSGLPSPMQKRLAHWRCLFLETARQAREVSCCRGLKQAADSTFGSGDPEQPQLNPAPEQTQLNPARILGTVCSLLC